MLHLHRAEAEQLLRFFSREPSWRAEQPGQKLASRVDAKLTVLRQDDFCGWIVAGNLTPNPFLRTLTPGADAVPSPAKKRERVIRYSGDIEGKGDNRVEKRICGKCFGFSGSGAGAFSKIFKR